MDFRVSHPEVLNNLIRFGNYLLEIRKEQKESRKYKVLLNRKTGSMRFAQKIKMLEQKIAQKGKENPEDWKEAQIIVNDAAHFEMSDLKDLEPLALRIVKETINILNQRGLPEEEILKDLSSIHSAAAFEAIETHPAWVGSVNRIDAEKLLESEPIGTYLLREGDEITVSTSFHVAEENHLWIHPYILTVVEPDEKITDILILHTNKGWIRYLDDPNLKDPSIYNYAPTLEKVIAQIKEIPLKPYRRKR